MLELDISSSKFIAPKIDIDIRTWLVHISGNRCIIVLNLYSSLFTSAPNLKPFECNWTRINFWDLKVFDPVGVIIVAAVIYVYSNSIISISVGTISVKKRKDFVVFFLLISVLVFTIVDISIKSVLFWARVLKHH